MSCNTDICMVACVCFPGQSSNCDDREKKNGIFRSMKMDMIHQVTLTAIRLVGWNGMTAQALHVRGECGWERRIRGGYEKRAFGDS